MSPRINDLGPDFTAETTQGLHIGILSSNNPKNLPFSSRMDVSRLGGDHLAECDDKETRREK